MNDKIATVALLRHGGSHLIRPIVDKLGFSIIEPGYKGAPLDKAIGPVIVFLRDPRNRMAATLRWWRGRGKLHKSVADATSDVQLLFLLRDKGFLEDMLRWATVWCNWKPNLEPPPLRIHFETIDENQVNLISVYLGLPFDTKRDKTIFEETYGRSRTYTGNHSKWEEYFGPLSIDYWNKNGGKDLLSLMGYI